MSLTISMDKSTKDWIAKKGEALTISKLYINNCCVPMEEVLTTYEVPSNVNRYERIQLDNLFVFVEKILEFKSNNITVKLSGFKPFQTLKVEGLKRF